MVAHADTPEPRVPLTRQRVLEAAVAFADAKGIDALSMRKLGQEVGVEAMSLYNHVKNKDDLLAGMIEVLIAGIELLDDDDRPWREALSRQIGAAREQMMSHKWAPAVMEELTSISPAVFRYTNAIVGQLRRGGFSYDLAHHALHALGSRAFGFTQELFEPGDDADEVEMMRVFTEIAEEVPYLAEMFVAITHDDPDDAIGWCDDQTEFFFALDLILDGLERLRHAETEA